MDKNKTEILVCQNCTYSRLRQDFKNNACVFDPKSIKDVGLYDSCDNHIKFYHVPNIVNYVPNIIA